MKEKSILNQTFVDLCECDFEKRMDHVYRKLTRKYNADIITLSGPTCSGKTTLAKKIVERLKDSGKTAYCISVDDYFKDRENIETVDMDSVNAIDLDILEQNIISIKEKKPLRIPAFDFVSEKRIGHKIVEPGEYDVFIFEGIQAIYPEVVSLFEGTAYKSVYISVDKDPVLGGIAFNRKEIRFLRRLVRDFRFRAANAERTFGIWNDSVIPNEEKSIDPNIGNAEIRISSYMPYEIFVLKPSVDKILSEVPDESIYKESADGILKKLADFESISENHIPPESLYREFIG